MKNTIRAIYHSWGKFTSQDLKTPFSKKPVAETGENCFDLQHMLVSANLFNQNACHDRFLNAELWDYRSQCSFDSYSGSGGAKIQTHTHNLIWLS